MSTAPPPVRPLHDPQAARHGQNAYEEALNKYGFHIQPGIEGVTRGMFQAPDATDPMSHVSHSLDEMQAIWNLLFAVSMVVGSGMSKHIHASHAKADEIIQKEIERRAEKKAELEKEATEIRDELDERQKLRNGEGQLEADQSAGQDAPGLRPVRAADSDPFPADGSPEDKKWWYARNEPTPENTAEHQAWVDQHYPAGDAALEKWYVDRFVAQGDDAPTQVMAAVTPSSQDASVRDQDAGTPPSRRNAGARDQANVATQFGDPDPQAGIETLAAESQLGATAGQSASVHMTDAQAVSATQHLSQRNGGPLPANVFSEHRGDAAAGFDRLKSMQTQAAMHDRLSIASYCMTFYDAQQGRVAHHESGATKGHSRSMNLDVTKTQLRAS